MSYSFNVRSATKQEALDKVTEQLDKVLAQQPIHSKDREQAQKAAEAFAAIITDNAELDVYISVSGSLSWNGQDDSVTSASVSVTAMQIAKEVPKD